MHRSIYSNRCLPSLLGVCSFANLSAYGQTDLRISEFVVDPQQDWNQDGRITPSDEWFEICNTSQQPFDMYGIELRFVDTTPNAVALTNRGILNPGERFVVLNPEGMQNNDGRIELYDVVNQRIIDAVSYGNWTNNIFGVPHGNATGLFDEAICRYPEYSDVFYKTTATYNAPNVPAPSIITVGGLTGLLLGSRRKRAPQAS